MELHIDLECPQGKDDIKIPTPVELQIDLECPQGKDDIKIPTPMELQIDLECPQGKGDIKILTPWNFKLTWNVHKEKMISKFPHPEQHTVFLPSPLFPPPPLVPYATSLPPLCHCGSFQICGVRFRLFASESALLVSDSACCSFRILVSESVLVLVSESALGVSES